MGAVTLEHLAALLAVMYLLLAVRENIWCWACAFLSTALYVYVFYGVALMSESLLNGFYLVMAVYGWWQWRRGGGDRGELPIQSWSWRRPRGVIGATALWVPPLGWYMQTRHGAALPYLDAFTTCFAVVTTFMVARKVLENWIYWFVIDSVSIYLYLVKGLYSTAALFGLYLVLIVLGWRRWRRNFLAQQAA